MKRERLKNKKAILKSTPVKQSMPSKKSVDFRSVILLIAYLLILSVTFFKVYHHIFDKKIYLGGDNADYYILGNSLANGQGYTEIHTIEKKPASHFSPGYPVVMSVFIKLFSNNIITLTYVNGFFLWLSVLVLFYLFYRFSKNIHLAFIISIFTILNYHLLQYSTIMMSEIPFLFFSSLCLLLFAKTDFEKPFYKNLSFLGLLLCLSFTFHIRTTGVAILMGILLVLLIKKKWKYLGLTTGGFFLLALPWFIRNRSLGGNGYVSQLLLKNPYREELGTMVLSDWFTRISNNLQRYITREIPNGCFGFISVNYKDPIVYSEWIIGLLILIVIAYGIYKLTNYRLLVSGYLLGTFGILIVWPDVWIGIRFLLPVIPILLFLLFYGLFEAGKWLLSLVNIKNHTLIQAGLPFCFLFSIPLFKPPIEILHNNVKKSYPNEYKNYFEIADWAKQNTEKDAVICCRKGNLFYLFSNRYVIGYQNTLDREEQVKFLKSKGTDYVVLEQLGFASTGRYLFPVIQRYPEKFKVLKHVKEPDTYIMKFDADLGYWGEWKDDKKEGWGTYTWDNGNKFEGEWKNNTRNGKGTLYYTNGEKMEGYWEEDTLNGDVSFLSKEGVLLKKVLYQKNVAIREINF